MKKMFFAVAMTIATFAFIGCQKEYDYISIYGDCEITSKETAEYSLVTDHKNSSIKANVITDNHSATLLENGFPFDEKDYAAKFEVSVTSATFLRSIAKQLENKEIDYNNGFNLYSQAIYASARLISCESVTFNANNSCYCHPQFQVANAIAKLDCCTPEPILIEFGKINGNVISANVIFMGHEEVAYPVEFAITEDDVYNAYPENARFTGNYTVSYDWVTTKNGQEENRETFDINVNGSLECGEMIEINNLNQLSHGSTVEVKDNKANIVLNITNFTATANVPSKINVSRDGKNWELPLNYSSIQVTPVGEIVVEDKSAANIDIYNTASYKLLCDGYEVAADSKVIRQTLSFFAEFEKEENGIVYFILHGKEDTRFQAPSGISVYAGADQTKDVKDLSLKANTSSTGNWQNNGTKTANGVKYNTYSRIDTYVYTNGISNNVTVTKNDDYTIVYNGYEYKVAMSNVSVNNGISSGISSNDADFQKKAYTLSYSASRNQVTASDEMVVTLRKAIEKPTFAGYEIYMANRWAITRVFDRQADQTFVVLVGLLKNISTGDIVAYHQVLEGNANANELPQQFQKVGAPKNSNDPFSLRCYVDGNGSEKWEYGYLIGTEIGQTNTIWSYFNWSNTDNQPMSATTVTDIFDKDFTKVWLDGKKGNAERITLSYNGTTITIISDK